MSARYRSARRGEPRLRGGRVGQCTDAVRIGIAGAAEGGLRYGLQGDGGIVLLQPCVDLIVGERYLAQSLIGALLRRGRRLFPLRLGEGQFVLQQSAFVKRPFELQQRRALRLGDREVGGVVYAERPMLPCTFVLSDAFGEQ